MFKWYSDSDVNIRVAWSTKQKLLNPSFDYNVVEDWLYSYNIVYRTSFEFGSHTEYSYMLIRDLSYWTWVSNV